MAAESARFGFSPFIAEPGEPAGEFQFRQSPLIERSFPALGVLSTTTSFTALYVAHAPQPCPNARTVHH